MSKHLSRAVLNVQSAPASFNAQPEALDLLADLVAQSHHGTRYERGRYAGGWNLSFAGQSDRGFHVVLDGDVSVRLEGGTVLQLRTGDLALLSVPHELATDLDRAPIPFGPEAALALSDEEGDVSLLCGAYILADAKRHPVFSNLPPAIVLRAGARDPSVDVIIEVLDVELSGASPGVRTVAERLVDALLVYALRHFLEEACPNAHGWLKALRDPTLARALALIHRDYGAPWTLESLAKAAGTSRASLARHFTAQVGTPPMQYLTERRLDAARRLMLTGTASLSEVADAVGYASQFSLSKAFKRHFGEAPTHFATSVTEPR